MKKIIEKWNNNKNKLFTKKCVFVDSHKFAGSHRSGGFTLIEMLIAMAIFTSSITGLIVVTSSGIANVNFAKNKLTATYLAQEGIESIRNLRDTLYFFQFGNQDPSEAWLSTVAVFETATNGCVVLGAQDSWLENEFGCNVLDTGSVFPSIGRCTNDQDKDMDCGSNINPLKIDQNGFFTPPPQGNLGTAFRRVIKIENIGTTTNTPEIRVTVEVAWQQGTKTRRVSATENLFGWK